MGALWCVGMKLDDISKTLDDYHSGSLSILKSFDPSKLKTS